MVIRCERCSTLYDLDEARLDPSGSPVQCSHCQHLFTAYPPATPGRALAEVPARAAGGNGAGAARAAAEPAPAPAVPAAPAIPKARSAPFGPRATSASGAGKPEPKPVRTAPPAVYRPAAPAAGAAASPAVARGPVLRRDAVGAFEARLRRSARMRWLAPVLAVAAVLALAVGWFFLARRGANPTGSARQGALVIAARDDSASLDEAIARLEEIERRSPALRAATAERAFVQALRAGSLADEGELLAGRLAARAGERDLLRREQPSGWEQAERAAASEAQALEPEVRARQDRSRALAASALESLRHVQAQAGDTPEVVRGLAAYRAFAGGRERVEAAPRAARGAARDPWLDLASAALDAREPERAARERAVGSLRSIAASHPELLRGRLLLARAQASLGHRAEALATLDALLAANARHEGARRLREDLAAPAVPAAVAAVPEQAGKPAAQRRKISSQPNVPETAPPPVAARPAGAPTPPAPPAGVAAPAEPVVSPTAPLATPAATPAAAPRASESTGAGGPGDAPKAPVPRQAPKAEPDTEPVRPQDGG